MTEQKVTTSEYTTSRRSLLAAAATTAGLGIAGCTDSDTPESGPANPDETPDSNAAENQTPTATPEPQIELVRLNRDNEQAQTIFEEGSYRKLFPLNDVDFHEESVEVTEANGEINITADFTNNIDTPVEVSIYGWAYDGDVGLGESGSPYDYHRTLGTGQNRLTFQIPLSGSYQDVTKIEYVVFENYDPTRET